MKMVYYMSLSILVQPISKFQSEVPDKNETYNFMQITFGKTVLEFCLESLKYENSNRAKGMVAGGGRK